MTNGPFSSYAPPGVYTTTRNAQQITGPPAGIRIPVMIGTGQEVLSNVDFELVRGSSASVDQSISNEDVSQRFIVDETNLSAPVLGDADGILSRFQVANVPLVTGAGTGSVTNRPQDVQVLVDGVQVVVAAVDGERGVITLQIPPPQGAEVRVSYFFNRTDTFRTDDLSEQVTDWPATLSAGIAGPYQIVAGMNDQLRLNVNGQEVQFSLAAGSQTAVDMAASINLEQVSGLSALASIDNQGNQRLVLSATGSLQVLDSTAIATLGLTAGTLADRNRTFYTYFGPIVDGTNGGVTTTNVADVRVLVNGQEVTPARVDGANRAITLAQAPVVGSEVVVEYYHNTFQDTFDYLPNQGITSIQALGDSPGRTDYVQGQDFIVRDDTIYWGSAVTVETGDFTAAGTNQPFGADQISVQLADNRVYLQEVDRLLDTALSPARESATVIVLPEVPTDGSGRDNPTSDVRLVQVYHGTSLQAAVQAGAVTVTKVDPTSRRVTVKYPIPFGHQIFASYFYNRLQDDTYTIRRTQSGRVRVTSDRTGTAKRNVRWVSTNSSATIQWPSGVESRPDALITGTSGIDETVSVFFHTVGEEPAVFTASAAGPYDLFSGASDTIDFILNDDVEGVSSSAPNISVDLDQAAPAMLISGAHGATDVFELTGPLSVLSLRVDGIPLDVTIAGAGMTFDAVVTAINTASNAEPQIASDIAFYWTGTDRSYFILRSPTTPANPSDVSSIQVLDYPLAEVFKFEAGASAQGTLSGVNQGATLLSDTITSAMITNIEAQQLDFEVRIDGVNQVVQGFLFSGVASVSDIATAIGGQLSGATVTAEGSKIRITSSNADATSTVEIGDGPANQFLGFEGGQIAGQRRPSASDVVAVMNNNTDFDWTNGVTYNVNTSALEFLNFMWADTVSVSGVGEVIRVRTHNTGAGVSFQFVPLMNSALGDYTGLGIQPFSGASGVSGVDGFSVISDRAEGSQGSGIVGQTYTDAVTGLRFTVLPAEGAGYTPGESFTLSVESEMVVGATITNRALDGVETRISTLTNVAPNDTAVVETFSSSGNEPGIGDYYYVSYQYRKEDFEPRLFTRLSEILANYGPLGPENPLSLALYLAILNGASIVGAVQVPRQEGSLQATAQDYINALELLKTDIQPGISADVIVPLATSEQVMAAVVKHCEIQSSPRYRNECTAIFGVASGTRPQEARQLARNLNSELAVLVYPDSAVMTLTNELGQEQSFLVDGTYMAAALAGRVVSPGNDVATPWTRRRLTGFTRLNRKLEETQKDQLATAGVTVLQDRTPFLEVRQGRTTNLDSVLTSVPSVIAIKQFVQRQSRATLDAFIGLKFLAGEAQNVEVALTGLLNSLVEARIIKSWRAVNAEPDPNDPTMLRVSALYSPVLPLLYIPITFTITSGS